MFASARIGAVSGTPATEYQGFVADVDINLSGATLGIFAEGETYAKGYLSARQNDTTSPALDGMFVVRIYDSTISAAATVSGEGAEVAEIYADEHFTHSPVGFGFSSKINSDGFVIADGDTDGRLTNSDVTVLVRNLSGFGGEYDADLDGDGKINNRDAIALIRLLSGKEN